MKRNLVLIFIAVAAALAQQPVKIALPVNGSGNVQVDGSAVTQPVSGTFWQSTQPVSLATAPSTPVTGTFWQATQPVSGTVTTTPPANASTNVAQVAGTTTDTNSGNKSAGTIRVVLATDQPALTNKLLVTPDSVALPANQSVNVNQIGGTAVVADPCQANAKTYFPISITASTQLVAGTSAKKLYVCAINLVAGAATNVALVEGTGSVCGTGTVGMAGGSTAATGWNLAANGGLTFGNGAGSVMASATNADNTCLLLSAGNQVSGTLAYVVQ